jgi:hypothetical protein
LLKNTLKYTLITLTSLLTLQALLFNGLGYERLIHLWQWIGGNKASIEEIRLHRFREDAFAFHAVFAPIAAVFFATITWWFLKNQDKTIEQFFWIKNTLKNAFFAPLRDFKTLNSTEKIAFLSVFGGMALFYTYAACVIPMSYDEAWTYLMFTKEGVAEAASFYPMPNNHVLFSIFTCFTNIIKIYPTLQMRIVSIVAMLLSAWIMWRWLRNIGDFWLALASILLQLSFFAAIYYGVLARGYALQTLFVALSAYSIYCLDWEDEDKKYRFFYILGIVCGFWTLPTFLYVAVSLHFVYLWVLRKRFALFFKDSIAISIGIFICYFPLLVRNGVMALVSNSTTIRLSAEQFYAQLPAHLHQTMVFLTNYSASTTLLALTIILIFVFKIIKTRSLLAALGLAVFLSPLCLLLHQVIPFERTWTFLILPISLAGFVFLDNINDLFYNKYHVTKVVFFIVFCYAFVQINAFLPDYENRYGDDYEFLAALNRLPKKENNTAFTDDWWSETQLQYLATIEKKPICPTFLGIDNSEGADKADIALIQKSDTKNTWYHRFASDTNYIQINRPKARTIFFIRK